MSAEASNKRPREDPDHASQTVNIPKEELDEIRADGAKAAEIANEFLKHGVTPKQLGEMKNTLKLHDSRTKEQYMKLLDTFIEMETARTGEQETNKKKEQPPPGEESNAERLSELSPWAEVAVEPFAARQELRSRQDKDRQDENARRAVQKNCGAAVPQARQPPASIGQAKEQLDRQWEDGSISKKSVEDLQVIVSKYTPKAE